MIAMGDDARDISKLDINDPLEKSRLMKIET